MPPITYEVSHSNCSFLQERAYRLTALFLAYYTMVDLHGLPAAGEYWLAMVAKVDQEVTTANPERDFSIIDEDVKLAAIKICMNRGISTTPKQVDGTSRQPGIGNGSNEQRQDNGGGRTINPRDTTNGAYGAYGAKNNRGRQHHHRERTRSPMERRRRAASPPPPPPRNGGKR
jgi:hypothetical protein